MEQRIAIYADELPFMKLFNEIKVTHMNIVMLIFAMPIIGRYDVHSQELVCYARLN